MTDTQVALWTEEIKKTGTGTLFTDPDGFVGVELKFGFHAKHPLNAKTLLREWVADIPGAAWKGEKEAWVVPDVRDIPRGALKAAAFVVQHADGTPAKPSDFAGTPPLVKEPVVVLKNLPSWFAIEPYDEQLEGAKFIVGGKHFLGDDPGTGKTIIGLAVAAMLQSKRTLVLCKPVALTHWRRTSEKSGLPMHVGGEAVVIRSGRKQPPLPTTGVVIVSAALVTNRPELASELAAWQPTLFLFDESQQVMTWTSRRSRVLRRLSESCTVSVPLTGTPSPSGSPLDLPAQLDIAGVFEPTFGTYLDYRTQYCRRTKFGWKPRKDRLEELNSMLESLWVRRTSKSERIVRSRLEVDIDRKGYEESLVVLYEKIDEWLAEFKDERDRPPDEDEVKEWCAGRGDLTSRLREAAGLAKVPMALEFVKEHFAEHRKKGAEYSSPLIVWAHHHSVTAALMEALAQYNPIMIDGTTSHTKRAVAEDEYQAGHVGVLVASIQAAGTSITLTRGNQSLFVELDWTPANIIQCECRQDRIGQQSDEVICTTLVAEGTLDERVADVLFGKGGDLEVMTRGDHVVMGKMKRRATGPVFASTLLAELVEAHLALMA